MHSLPILSVALVTTVFSIVITASTVGEHWQDHAPAADAKAYNQAGWIHRGAHVHFKDKGIAAT